MLNISLNPINYGRKCTSLKLRVYKYGKVPDLITSHFVSKCYADIIVAHDNKISDLSDYDKLTL